MKISKPKENQILIEDEKLRYFDTKVKSKTGLKDSAFNDLYESFILFYRTKDMDASKQIFFGNKLSLMTSMSSILEQLVRNKIMSTKDLDLMFDLIKQSLKENK